MITEQEKKILFENRDLIYERQHRLDRKKFPPVLEIPLSYSTDQLFAEYHSLKKKCPVQDTYIYEDLVIGEALSLKSRISRNCKDYFPLILSEPTDIAIEIQKAIDQRRGFSWIEHQKNMSSTKRVRSMMELDQNYDPLLDERTCKKHPGMLLSGYIGELFQSLSGRPTRTRFVFLKAGDKVETHIDNDPQYIVRAHFPIVSNSSCFNGFHFKGESYEYRMEPGKVYLVNNGIPHWGRNSGNTDRLHLVISLDGQEDYLNNQDFCKIPPLINLKSRRSE